MKAITPVKQQTSEARERILQAAISLFAQHGFAETSMRKLVAKADINLSMVNYYFGSKKGLLMIILDSFFAGYLAIAREELVTDDAVYARLERFLTRSVRYFDAEHDSLIIAISELPHDDPEIVQQKAGWAKKMVEIINREICQPLAAESDQHIQPTSLSPMLTFLMASRFFITPVLGKVDESSSNAVSIEVYTETIVRFVLQGITGFEKNNVTVK